VVKISELILYGYYHQNCTHIHFIDIRVKEPTFESLTKKRKEYQPPRFMSVNEAAEQLLEIIRRKHGDHEELGMCFNHNTVMPPYPLIQYPWFQSSAVYRGLKKIEK
jgi:hypothetical protein